MVIVEQVEPLPKLQSATVELVVVHQETLSTCSAVEEETLRYEIDVAVESLRKCIEVNSRPAQDQEEYTRCYEGYVKRYEAPKTKLGKLYRKE